MKNLNRFDAIAWTSWTGTSVMPFVWNFLSPEIPDQIKIANVIGTVTVMILFFSFGVFADSRADEIREMRKNSG